MRAAILDIIPQHHLLQSSDEAVGDLLVALVLHDPALRLSGAADGRRSRISSSGASSRRPNRAPASSPRGACRIHSLLQESRDDPRHVRGLSRDRDGIDFAMDTVDFDAGRKVTRRSSCCGAPTGSVGRNFKPARDLAALRRPTSRHRGAAAAGIIWPRRRRTRPTRSCGRFLPMGSSRGENPLAPAQAGPGLVSRFRPSRQ